MDKLLPSVPPIVEEINYETCKQEVINYLLGEGILEEYIESESYSVVIEAYVYDEIRLRSRINASAKATMLLSAENDDLDFKARDYDVERLDGEEDDAFRERCRLSLYRQSTAGGRGSYKFWVMSVSSAIKQVKVIKKGNGIVEVVYYNKGEINLQDAIAIVLSDEDIRPVSDTPIPIAATIIESPIVITLFGMDGYNKADVGLLILEAITIFNESIGIGDSVPVSKIYDVAHVEGVRKITLNINEDIVSTDYKVIQLKPTVEYGE